jgi:hypothetical protein
MQRVRCSTDKGSGEDLGQFALPLHVAIPQQWRPTYPSEYKEGPSGTVRVQVISVHHRTTRVHAYIQPYVHIYGCWSLTSSYPPRERLICSTQFRPSCADKASPNAPRWLYASTSTRAPSFHVTWVSCPAESDSILQRQRWFHLTKLQSIQWSKRCERTSRCPNTVWWGIMALLGEGKRWGHRKRRASGKEQPRPYTSGFDYESCGFVGLLHVWISTFHSR